MTRAESIAQLLAWKRERIKPLSERFWNKVDKSDGCWMWRGAHDRHGYGQIWSLESPGRLRAASVAWFLAFHEWPPAGADVCHHCDTPACVRPDHLFLGDAKANMRDCITKGRFCFLEPRLGVRNNKAKMTATKVRDARRLFSNGATVSALARRFGLARSTMREILYGRNWRDPDVPVIPRGQTSRKLSSEQRDELKTLHASGQISRAQLARMFRVDPSTVARHLGLR